LWCNERRGPSVGDQRYKSDRRRKIEERNMSKRLGGNDDDDAEEVSPRRKGGATPLARTVEPSFDSRSGPRGASVDAREQDAGHRTGRNTEQDAGHWTRTQDAGQGDDRGDVMSGATLTKEQEEIVRQAVASSGKETGKQSATEAKESGRGGGGGAPKTKHGTVGYSIDDTTDPLEVQGSDSVLDGLTKAEREFLLDAIGS
jgi:hypothetical protein